MSTDLIAELRAALDAEEETAHAAAAVCGCHPEMPSWSFGDDETDGRIAVNNDPHPKVRRKMGRRWNGSYEGMFTAQHIVRHDPKFALADIAAKRAVIDAHAGSHACPSYDWVSRDVGSHTLVDADEVCTTVRLLAEAYGIRP